MKITYEGHGLDVNFLFFENLQREWRASVEKSSSDTEESASHLSVISIAPISVIRYRLRLVKTPNCSLPQNHIVLKCLNLSSEPCVQHGLFLKNECFTVPRGGTDHARGVFTSRRWYNWLKQRRSRCRHIYKQSSIN